MIVVKGGYKSYPNSLKEQFRNKKQEIVYNELYSSTSHVKTKRCDVGQTLGGVEYLVNTFEGLFTTKVIRNILKSLVEDGFITIVSNRNGNIVTIVDYKARHSFTPYKKDSESYIKKGKEWNKEKSSKTPKLSYEEQGKVWDEENKKRAYIKAGGSPTADDEFYNHIMKQIKLRDE